MDELAAAAAVFAIALEHESDEDVLLGLTSGDRSGMAVQKTSPDGHQADNSGQGGDAASGEHGDAHGQVAAAPETLPHTPCE
jgi:hypothetical protein